MSFDPNIFLNQEVTDANSTVSVPISVGEYPGICEKIEVKQWSAKDGSSSGLKLALIWDIQDDAQKELTGRNPLRSKQDIMLDLTETGALDFAKGKNIGLGRLREALDLNTPGAPFSFGMVQGRMALCKVNHREFDGNMFDEVKAVAKLV